MRSVRAWFSARSGRPWFSVHMWRSREVAAWLVLASSLLITFAAWRLTQQYVEMQVRKQFEYDTEEVRARVLARMDAYQQILRGGVAFINSLQRLPTRSQWRQYVASLELGRAYPGIQGLGFSLMLKGSERAAHEAALRAEGFPSYQIRPLGERPLLSSIIYLEPFTGRNLRAFGYDMFSEPVRAAAMQQACDTGLPALTGPVRLVQETSTDVQTGVLMYLPVYRFQAPVDTLEARREALLGFVYSPFRSRDLLEGILGKVQRDVVYQLYDGSVMTPESLLFDVQQADEVFQKEDMRLRRRTPIDLPGRTWTLHFAASSTYSDKVARLPTSQILVTGLTVNLLLIYFFVRLFRQRWVLEAQKRRLELSDQALKRAQKVARLGSWVLDRQTGEFSGSEELRSILGLDPEGPLNMVLLRTRVHPDDLVLFDEAMERAFSGLGVDIEGRLFIDGSVRWIWVHSEPPNPDVSPDVNPDVNDLPSQGTLQDITELKDVKLELWRNIERIRLIAETVAGYASFQLDPQGRILSWNREAEALTGFPESYAVGKPLDDCLRIELPARFTTQQRLYMAATQGRQVVEGWFLRRDGQRFYADTIVAAHTDDNKRLLGYIQLIRDTTERRQMEEELALARDRANAANEAKSLFLASMSHEVRTPMNAILGLTRLAQGELERLLRTDPRLADIIRMLQRAQAASRSLLHTLNEILDFTKIEADKLELESAPMLLRPVLEQLLGLFQGLCYEKGLRLELELDPATPPWITGDRLRLEQVLSNLLSNALKFTENGTVWLKVGPSSQQLMCVVEDTGIGIPADRRDRIFKAFSQADSSMTRRYGGTGLGLAICLRLVQRMGGTLSLESQEGRGSRFIVLLPLRVPEEAELTQWLASAQEEARDSGPLEASRGSAAVLEGAAEHLLRGVSEHFDPGPSDAPTWGPLAGVHILVVDDNSINAEVVAAQLQQWGVIASLAEDGAQALERVQVQPPDLVLMDLQMPHMDGFEATRRIRALPQSAHLPIVALSASALLTEQEACLAAGMDAHLAKPLEPERLLSTLKCLLAGGTRLPGFDLRAALERLGGNQVLLDRLLAELHTLCCSTREALGRPEGLAEGSTVRELVHRVRGPALNLGALWLADAARALEQAVRQRRLEGIQAFVAVLERTERDLSRYLEGRDLSASTPERVEGSVPSTLSFQTALEQLGQELEAHRPPSPEVLAGVLAALRARGQDGEAVALARALHQFQFDAALGVVRALERPGGVA